MKKDLMAAAVLLLVDPEVSAELIRGMEEDDLSTLVRSMSGLRLSDLDGGGMERILETFRDDLARVDPLPTEGPRRLQDMYRKALGEDRAKRLLAAGGKSDENPFASLEALTTEQAAETLAGEHPQVVAQALLRIPPSRAAQILGRMEIPEQVRVGEAMTLARPLGQDLQERLAGLLRRKGEDRAGPRFSMEHSAARSGKLLKHLAPPVVQEILEHVEPEVPGLAQAIKDRMYTLEDLAALPAKAVQTLLGDVDSKTLALAVKQMDGSVRDALLRNLSKRARDSVLEESDLLGEIPEARVKEAQQDLLKAFWGLMERGAIQTVPEGKEGSRDSA